MIQKERQPYVKPVGQWSKTLAITIALIAGAVSLYSVTNHSTSQSPPPVTSNSAPVIVAVTALGRVEPQGEVTRLSASYAAEGSRVVQLLVKEGEKVHAGQVVAILDGYESRLAALNQTKQQVKVAQARLAKVKAGAQTGEIAAQKATIARLQAELRGETAALNATITRVEAELSNAKAEYQRYQDLYKNGAISASMFDSKRLILKTMQAQLNEAKATLKRTSESFQEQIDQAKATLAAIAEVRPVDVQVAQAEVGNAIAAVKRAEADLNLTYVRSPINSRVLKIHIRPGEIVNNTGIADLGQTNQMYVRAEVYETDIRKVRLGQRATIISEAFSSELQGRVSQIGLQVSQQGILSVNPTADTDRKVVEVEIRIADPADNQRLATLTNLQVQVAIQI